MTPFVYEFATWLADYYLLATVLLVLAVAAMIAVKQPVKRRAITHSTLVGLSLLAVLCALPGWSLLNLTSPLQPTAVDEPAARSLADSERRNPSATTSTIQFHSDVPLEDAATEPPPSLDGQHANIPQVSPTPPFGFSWSALSVIAWAIGAFCALAWLAIGLWAANRLRRNSQPAPVIFKAMLRDLDHTARRRTTELLTSSHIDVAVALGVWRPAVLLPTNWLRTQSPDDLRTVLAHEAAHLRNHDLHWLTLSRALNVLLWAQPLFWFLRRRMRLDQEALADAAAAELTSRQCYAEQLVAWAREMAARPTARLSSAVGLWEGPSQLRRRIALLLDERITLLRQCPRRWRLFATAVFAFAAIGLSLITLQPRTEAHAEQSNTKSGEQDKRPATDEDNDSIYTAPITVSGRTLDRDGNLIAGATVYLAAYTPGYKRLTETKSNELGEYTFENVELPIKRSGAVGGQDSGGFEVFGFADGHAIAWRGQKWFYPKTPHYRNELLDPSMDRPHAFGTEDPIDLDLTLGPPATVRGRIVDDHGLPIPNVLLDIRDADSQWDQADYNIFTGKGDFSSLNEREIVPRDFKTRTTDADGRFEFTGLPFDHRFWIWVHAPGFPTKHVWAVTNDTIDAESKGPKVYSGEINLTLDTPRDVPIQVVYGDTGKPAPKVFVSAGGSSGTTDADGRVQLRLPDGEYELHLLQRIDTPYRPTETEFTISQESVKQPAQVKLQPAAVVDISVVDAETGEPLKGVDVWRQVVYPPNPPRREVYGYRSWEVETRISHYEQPRTDADGKMRVLFEPGRHVFGVGLEAYPSGYTPVEPDGKLLYVKAGKPQTIQFQLRKTGGATNATTEQAHPAPTKPPRSAPNTFAGRAVDEKGKPLVGAEVFLFRTNHRDATRKLVAQKETNADG